MKFSRLARGLIFFCLLLGFESSKADAEVSFISTTNKKPTLRDRSKLSGNGEQKPDALSVCIQKIQTTLKAWTKPDPSSENFLERYKKQEEESNRVIQKAMKDWQAKV